jgi:hypothetical protein
LIFVADDSRQDGRPEGVALSGCPWAAGFGPWVSFARRPPMFVFVLDAALLQFTFHRPALAPLFQLPPTIGKYSR